MRADYSKDKAEFDVKKKKKEQSLILTERGGCLVPCRWCKDRFLSVLRKHNKVALLCLILSWSQSKLV